MYIREARESESERESETERERERRSRNWRLIEDTADWLREKLIE